METPFRWIGDRHRSARCLVSLHWRSRLYFTWDVVLLIVLYGIGMYVIYKN